MNRILVLFGVLLLGAVSFAGAQERFRGGVYALPDAIAQRYDAYAVFLSQATDNPAQQGYKYPSGLSSFYVRGNVASGRYPVFFQQGTGQMGLLFEAQSYLKRKRNTHVWGMAHYDVRYKKHVSWLSSADVELLYPYFLADTLGGNLKAEEYAFQGGYSRRFGRWDVGGEVDYRASQEYRTVDPRPRNIVSDLSVRVGTAYLLSEAYSAGLSVAYRAYQQRGDVLFFKETGGISELQMDGLGSHYGRFDGSKSDLCYQLSGVRTSLNLLPVDGKGFYADAAYAYARLKRVMYGLNQAPINSYVRHSLPVALGYVRDGEGAFAGVGVKGEYSCKQGWNNIISESTRGEYLPVGRLPMYAERVAEANVFIEYAFKGGRKSWDVTPALDVKSIKMEYLHPHRELQLGKLRMDLKSGVTWRREKAVYRSEVAVMYDYCFRHRLDIPVGLIEPFERVYLYTTFDRAAANLWGIGCSESAHWQLGGKLAFYAALSVQGRFYADSNRTWAASLSVGMSF